MWVLEEAAAALNADQEAKEQEEEAAKEARSATAEAEAETTQVVVATAARAAAAATAQQARLLARAQRKQLKQRGTRATDVKSRSIGASSHGGWRCPYVKISLSTSMALVGAVLLVLAGSRFWLGGDDEQATPAVEISAPPVQQKAGPPAKPHTKRSRQKKKASTSQFRIARVAASTAATLTALDIPDEPTAVFGTGFGASFEPYTQSAGALPSLDADECTEGWVGTDCLECAPGFGGDFCDQRLPVPGAPGAQADLRNYQIPQIPRQAEIHLRDYLPGSAVFSSGVSVVEL